MLLFDSNAHPIQWSETVCPLLAQASRALVMTALKLRKSVYSGTRASSCADQKSAPAGLTRLMRSNVLVAAGTGKESLMAFVLSDATVQMKNEFFAPE
jgi:hypothetical protein